MPDIKRHWVTQIMQDHFGERGMKDWGDDKGRVREVEIRCNRINNRDESGCGWTGVTRVIDSLGSASWSIEECPRCDSPVVGFDE